MKKILHVNLSLPNEEARRATEEYRAFSALGGEFSAVNARTDEELITAAQEAEVILFTSARFDAGILERLPKLRLLVRYGMGYDTVDLAAARRLGIDVCNAPSYGATAVSEHTFSLLMAANRKIPQYDAAIRSGKFGAGASYPSYSLCGKTLGMIGFGRIARRVAAFGRGFGMETAACDPYISEECMHRERTRKLDLDALLETSDFICINSLLNESTYHMLGEEAFGKMKKSAVLVNTARGALVDEDALYRALAERKIRAAGIDVYENYPTDPDNRFLKLDNIVMTPHIAWDTAESKALLKEEVIAEVCRYLRGEAALNVVNR